MENAQILKVSFHERRVFEVPGTAQRHRGPTKPARLSQILCAYTLPSKFHAATVRGAGTAKISCVEFTQTEAPVNIEKCTTYKQESVCELSKSPKSSDEIARAT